MKTRDYYILAIVVFACWLIATDRYITIRKKGMFYD